MANKVVPGEVTQSSWAARARRVHEEWNAAVADGDVAGLLSLYAPDATIESPLIPHLMNTDEGVVRGRAEIRALLARVFERKPDARRYYRTSFFTNGSTLVWEYPRAAPDGEQMDFVEIMELTEEGLIRHHRVYWGWYGVRVLQQDGYHR